MEKMPRIRKGSLFFNKKLSRLICNQILLNVFRSTIWPHHKIGNTLDVVMYGYLFTFMDGQIFNPI
jgi:hypothetical protein